MVQRESGWIVGRKNVQNGRVVACGLGQANPCSKMGDGLGNAEAEIDFTINHIANGKNFKTPRQALHFWLHVAPTIKVNGKTRGNWY